MTVIIGVVTFPGSLDDRDAFRAVAMSGGTPVRLWHADPNLRGVDAVILPGGIGISRRIESAETVLPQPLSPTRPRISPGMTS